MRLGASVSTIPATTEQLEMRAEMASFQAQLDALKCISAEEKEKPPEKPFRKMPAQILESPVFPDNQLGMASQLTTERELKNEDFFGPSEPAADNGMAEASALNGAQEAKPAMDAPTVPEPVDAKKGLPEPVNEDAVPNAVEALPKAHEAKEVLCKAEAEQVVLAEEKVLPKAAPHEEGLPGEEKALKSAEEAVPKATEAFEKALPKAPEKALPEGFEEALPKATEEALPKATEAFEKALPNAGEKALPAAGEALAEAADVEEPKPSVPKSVNDQREDLIAQLQSKLLAMQARLDESTAAEQTRLAKEKQPKVSPAIEPDQKEVAAAKVTPDLAALGSAPEEAAEELDPDMRALILQGSSVRPKDAQPPEEEDAEEADDEKINTNTHRNAAMRLRRSMESSDAQKYPYMKQMFDGSAEVAWICFVCFVLI